MSEPGEDRSAPVGRLPQFRVVGFTGHRHLADHAGASRAIRGAIDALRREVPEEWIALSSIAGGGDQLFVHEMLALGLTWHAILPLPRSEFAEDFTPAEWSAVEETLTAADHVRVIAESADRKDGYLDCGIETVNGADVLIALWDGELARGKGGTADVVQFAQSMGKPVLIIDAVTFEVRRENWNRLESSDAVLADLNAMPDAPSASVDNPFLAPDAVYLFQQKCDHHASQGAPQYRRLLVSMVAAHLVATVVGAMVVSYGLHLLALPWVELTCISFALGAALVLRRRLHSHHSWVRCRLAAEFCRSALATWGLPRAAPLLQDLDLVGTRGLTRALYVLHSRTSSTLVVPIEEFKRIYLAKRIDDQLGYYARQVSRAQPLYSRLTAGFWIATVLALATTTFYAVSRMMHAELPNWLTGTTYVFLPISLPAVAALMISMISINDLGRRVARYKDMRSLLEISRTQVVSCRTWNSLERVVLKTEHALLQEVIEWHSIRSFAGSH
jgi:hypothetical protein